MLRDVHLGVLVPFVLATIAGAGCETRTPADSSSGIAGAPLPAETAAVTRVNAADLPGLEALPPASSTADVPLACATLRDVTTSDVVRIEGTTLYYAETTTGLTIVDVADPTSPRRLASVPFVGAPFALFVRDGIAWVVFVDFDARSDDGAATTVIRAVDVRRPDAPVRLGEEARPGVVRDARLVGGILYTLTKTARGSVVESFAVRKGKAEALDAVALDGAPAQLAASAAGLAAVTTSENEAAVSWIDLPLDGPGWLVLRGTQKIKGGVATWDRGGGRIVDADEGQRVRVVTCATRSCSPTDGATLHVVDFGDAGPGRVTSSLALTHRGGLPITRFSNELLFVGETAQPARDLTTLRVFSTATKTPKLVATLALRGLVSGLVPRESSLVTLGTTTPAGSEAQVRIVLHDIDLRRPEAPRVRGSATFGNDWTWSPAIDSEEALSFDPGSNLVAVPFTAWRHADAKYLTGTQLVDLGRFGAQAKEAFLSDGFVERAVFLGGRLVTIGPEGVNVIDYATTRRRDLGERTLDLGRDLGPMVNRERVR